MALKAATTPLAFALTQGSADAFVQASVLTGLSGNTAYNVRQVFSELTNSAAISGTNVDAVWEMAITRRSKAAMPNLADTDVIWKRSLAVLYTTSGHVLVPLTEVWTPQLEVPIVEDTLYAQLDSNGSGLSNAAVVRLEVELDTMRDIDRLNLIARSLT